MDFHDYYKNKLVDKPLLSDENTCINVDDKKLILEVKKYPCLYEQSSKKKNICDQRKSAWIKVSKALNKDGDECQRRWRVIRERFCKQRIKYMNEMEKDPKKVNIARYSLYFSLKWLEPYAHTRKKSSEKERILKNKNFQLESEDLEMPVVEHEVEGNAVGSPDSQTTKHEEVVEESVSLDSSIIDLDILNTPTQATEVKENCTAGVGTITMSPIYVEESENEASHEDQRKETFIESPEPVVKRLRLSETNNIVNNAKQMQTLNSNVLEQSKILGNLVEHTVRNITDKLKKNQVKLDLLNILYSPCIA